MALFLSFPTVLNRKIRPTIDNSNMSDEATCVRPPSDNPASEVHTKKLPVKDGLEATLADIHLAIADQRLIDNILYVKTVCEQQTLFKQCESQDIDSILSVWCPLQALAKCCETQMPNTWLAPWILHYIKKDLSDALKVKGQPSATVVIQILHYFVEGKSDQMWQKVKEVHNYNKGNIETFLDINLTVLTVLQAICATLDQKQRDELKRSVRTIYGEDKHIKFSGRPEELEKFVERAHTLSPFYQWDEFFKASYEYFWRTVIEPENQTMKIEPGIFRPRLMTQEHLRLFIAAVYPVCDGLKEKYREQKVRGKMVSGIERRVDTAFEMVVSAKEWDGAVRDDIETAKTGLKAYVMELSNGADDSRCCTQ